MINYFKYGKGCYKEEEHKWFPRLQRLSISFVLSVMNKQLRRKVNLRKKQNILRALLYNHSPILEMSELTFYLFIFASPCFLNKFQPDYSVANLRLGERG